MLTSVVNAFTGKAGAVEISVQTKIVRLAHGADRKLALRITAILMGLAIAVIIGAVYAGIAMNSAALSIESGIIEKEIDRIVVKTLDEQKSVALWDEPLERIPRKDLGWIDEEIGSYLTGTYGHDLVIIQDGTGHIIYQHERIPGTLSATQAIAAADPILNEIRGGARRHWTKRDGNFASQESTDGALEGAATLRAGANILQFAGEPAVVSAMTFTPTTNLKLRSANPPIIISVKRLNAQRLAKIGNDINVSDLRLVVGSSAADDGLIELEADNGKSIGSLAWKQQMPGKAFLSYLLPVLLLLTVSCVLAGHYFVGKITMLAGRLRFTAEEARRLAYEDQVSKLPNRRAFHDRLKQQCAGEARPFVVALVDIDRFKEINDTYGHETGDRLIEAVSERLKDEIGGDGIVARLGGDEFAVMTSPRVDCDASSLKRRLGKLFEAPFQLGPYRILSSASLGIYAVTRPDAKPTDVLRNADTALYEAKSRGRRQGVIYSSQMSNAARARRLIERDLQDAIENGDLYMAYQPVHAIGSNNGNEVEALIRWRHPQLGELAPEAFVQVAEQSNLIVALGQKVFGMVLQQLKKWPDMHVSINLSPRELRSNELLRFVRNGCREHGIAPNRITFEITEGIAIDDSGKANLILQSLRAIGFRVALDDFGTGYASLSFLQTFPLDRVKLDRSLLGGAEADKRAIAVFEGAIAIGRQLGLEVVAEGIESEEQFNLAQRAGCTHLQGYLLSPPLLAHEVEQYFGIQDSDMGWSPYNRLKA
ncbi:putative bifunctional diguanylate cyclase/phosphodiesterase [Aquisediminimonas profunda]|uniref:putative bifunctional diguanylate cyclase/phosphodiesterase n=1 Tax=Aquisediminimonas profunda TaxID=1550733 RepID=UPI001C632D49|nr:bifunctional diguanylate cyclase/phosphodiesterase [Aquisediminimonas profunda]